MTKNHSCARERFRENYPESFKLLFKEANIPPVRTIVNLLDNSVVVRCWKADTWDPEVLEFDYTQDDAAKALYTLQERRLRADAVFASVHESDDMPTRYNGVAPHRYAVAKVESVTEQANPSPKGAKTRKHVRSKPATFRRMVSRRRRSRSCVAGGVVKRRTSVLKIVA